MGSTDVGRRPTTSECRQGAGTSDVGGRKPVGVWPDQEVSCHGMTHWCIQLLSISVLNGSGRPSLAPGRPRPDPEGQVKYGSGQRGPAVGQAGGRERWRFFRPPLTWADLGPTLDPEIRKRVVNLQKITLKSFISWGRVKFCVEL